MKLGQQGRARHDMGLHDMEIIPGSFGANEQMPQGTTYQELERDDGKGHSKTPGYGVLMVVASLVEEPGL